jgi:hypothetical protein
MKSRILALFARLAALAAAFHVCGAAAYVLVPKDPTYLKECGSCHTAFSPQLLPAASWKLVMSRLDNHFGDSAKVDAATQDALTRYLVDNAADHANSDESHTIMHSLGPGEVPARITDIPFIAGVHAAALDPRWNGQPRPKRLTECETCHVRAPKGDYRIQAFTVSDEAFSESKGLR